MLFLANGFGATVGRSENKATSVVSGVFGMAFVVRENPSAGRSNFPHLGLLGRHHAACSMRSLAAQPRIRSPTRRQRCARREGRRHAVQWKAGGGGDAQPNDHAQQRHIA